MEFSNAQIDAIKHFKGPCLVLAVPGAGKTTILISRIINLIEKHKVDPDRILALTFSRASALDMKNRMRVLSGGKNVKNIRTIHSLAYEIVAKYRRINNLPFNMVEDDKYRNDRFKVLDEISRKIEGAPLENEKYQNILSAISYVKCHYKIEITKKISHELGIVNLSEYFNGYEKYLKNNNLFDFDDLLNEAYDILKNNLDYCKSYQARFDFILLDEAQDTSDRQWDIIKLLLGVERNLFVVADDDQSIYKFRGASPALLMHFDREFKDAKILYMSTNYRSSSEIVNSANRLIKKNKIRYEKEIISDKGKLESVKVNILKNRDSQYKSIIETIPDLNGSIAIIYRKNLSAIAMMDALDRNNIEFNLKDHNVDFFRTSIVRDVYNIVDFIIDRSLEKYKKIYYKLNGYISKLELSNLNIRANEDVLDAIINDYCIPLYKRELITSLKSSLNYAQAHFAKNGLMTILESCGYVNYLNNLKSEQERALDSVLRYFKSMVSISKGLSPSEFLERLSYIKKLALYEKEDAKIELLSMHSSKGLEFDNVFLIDLIDGDIPGKIANKEDVEEERRLLYVGMTRAKERLFMYSYRADAGDRVEVTRFFKDLK
ncbi:MAG: ATP-dependent helicase [Ezakiella sp.]|nr:ATP-dependent helicase [Ezakiella sp.]